MGRIHTEVYSDGLGAFHAAVELGHAHTVIDAGGGRAATQANRARWVNTVLSNIRHTLGGIYHRFGFFKYSDRYLAEAQPPLRILVAATRCKLWPEHALRDVPVFNAC